MGIRRKLLAGFAIATCSLVWVAQAQAAAYLYLFDGPTTGSVGQITSGPIGQNGVNLDRPLICMDGAGGCSLTLLGGDANQAFAYVNGGGVDLQPGALGTPGLYRDRGVSGVSLLVLDLPSYSRGSFLYLFDGPTTSPVGQITSGPIEQNGVNLDRPLICMDGAGDCSLTLLGGDANQAFAYVNGGGVDLQPGALGTPGLYRDRGVSGVSLLVLRLPDEFAAAVPEPATWAMMIIGFGLTGAGMRRRRQNVTVRFA